MEFLRTSEFPIGLSRIQTNGSSESDLTCKIHRSLWHRYCLQLLWFQHLVGMVSSERWPWHAFAICARSSVSLSQQASTEELSAAQVAVDGLRASFGCACDKGCTASTLDLQLERILKVLLLLLKRAETGLSSQKPQRRINNGRHLGCKGYEMHSGSTHTQCHRESGRGNQGCKCQRQPPLHMQQVAGTVAPAEGHGKTATGMRLPSQPARSRHLKGRTCHSLEEVWPYKMSSKFKFSWDMIYIDLYLRFCNCFRLFHNLQHFTTTVYAHFTWTSRFWIWNGTLQVAYPSKVPGVTRVAKAPASRRKPGPSALTPLFGSCFLLLGSKWTQKSTGFSMIVLKWSKIAIVVLSFAHRYTETYHQRLGWACLHASDLPPRLARDPGVQDGSKMLYSTVQD